MISVNSYIKKEEVFLPLSKYEGSVPDPQYIEGAIQLTINGKVLLDRGMWDYVDQLWAYLIDGLTELSQNRTFSTYLPDQPVQIVFRPVQNGLVEVQVNYEAIRLKETIEVTHFMKAMGTAAESFLEKMLECVPDNRTVYTQLLRKTRLALSTLGQG